jgi:hypothetical protein
LGEDHQGQQYILDLSQSSLPPTRKLSRCADSFLRDGFDDSDPHLVIVSRGESKTQFVSNVFDGGVRWYSVVTPFIASWDISKFEDNHHQGQQYILDLSQSSLLDHVILLGSQGPCSGLSKLLFARIGEREERDDMYHVIDSFPPWMLPAKKKNITSRDSLHCVVGHIEIFQAIVCPHWRKGRKG